jgi:hypothetical protein
VFVCAIDRVDRDDAAPFDINQHLSFVWSQPLVCPGCDCVRDRARQSTACVSVARGSEPAPTSGEELRAL